MSVPTAITTCLAFLAATGSGERQEDLISAALRSIREGRAPLALKQLARIRRPEASSLLSEAKFLLHVEMRARHKVSEESRSSISASFAAAAQACLLPLLSSRAPEATKAGEKISGLPIDDALAILRLARARGDTRLIARMLPYLESKHTGNPPLLFLRGELHAQAEFFDRDRALMALKRFLSMPQEALSGLDDYMVWRQATCIRKEPDVTNARSAAQAYIQALLGGKRIQPFGTVHRRQNAERLSTRMQELLESALLFKEDRRPASLEATLVEAQALQLYNPVVTLSLGEVYASSGKTFNRDLAQLCFKRFLRLTSDAAFNRDRPRTLESGGYSQDSLLDDIARWHAGSRGNAVSDLRQRIRRCILSLQDGKSYHFVSEKPVLRKALGKLEALAKTKRRAEARISKLRQELLAWRRSSRRNRGMAISQLAQDIKRLKRRVKKIDDEHPELDKEIRELERLLESAR